MSTLTLEARPIEAESILTALDRVGPKALTACPGWTAHHLAGHIAGNYEEVTRHVEAHVTGRPLESTRSWDEREAPLRELGHAELLERIEREERAMRAAVGQALERDPDARLNWSGRTVRVSGFPTHMRSEDALHRWDLVGDDMVSHELLAQQDLLHHAVAFIGSVLWRRGIDCGAGNTALLARIRSLPEDDLLVQIGDGSAAVTVAAREGDEVLDADPAARLLLLWGRKPTPFSRLRAVGPEHDAAQVQLLFSGY